MARRLARTPREVAEQLARHYGHALDEAVYIPAVALMARLRLGAVEDVERIVKPYYDGARRSLPEKITGSHFSGHLVFGELHRLTRKPRYLELARAAADAMPYEDDMSDAVFMGCPILVQTGRLADEPRYFDAALRHFEKMRQLDLRKDGLYRHSPLDETAWGRGNGFPALGLALSLSDLPEGHAAHRVMLRAFRDHMAALAPHQDPLTGMWHQVIDHPRSYRELTATAMIAFAMHRGMARGWLERERYQAPVERAWTGLKARIAEDGTLLDVCTGTGKQRSLRDYLERTAIWGKDPRGGAMALLAAVELAGLR
jgi:rhamnogalacturonyl hydrolase YesR